MNKKGVTLIQLVITIVVMLIIASFAVFQGGNVTTEATIAKEYESLKEVKKAVEQTVLLMEINPETYIERELFGIPLDTEEKQSYYKRLGLTNVADLSDRTYTVTQENQKNFELEKIIEGKVYVVDLDNEKYYLLDGIQRENLGKAYEYKDILKMYNMLTGKN